MPKEEDWREKFYHSRWGGVRIPIPSDQQTLSHHDDDNDDDVDDDYGDDDDSISPIITIILHTDVIIPTIQTPHHTTSSSYSQIVIKFIPIRFIALATHSDHLSPGHLSHLLLLLKVEEAKEVGDPRIGRDVGLPT